MPRPAFGAGPFSVRRLLARPLQQSDLMHAVSVVIPTCNRRDLLKDALETLRQQQTDAVFEVIVADNGGTDRTDEVVAQAAANGLAVRLVVEPRRGVSFARNTATRAALADNVAFMDDDELAAPDWIQTLVDALDAHPDIDFFFGRVRAACQLPAWATREMLGAVAVVDWGDEVRVVDDGHWMCALGGNMVCRRKALAKVGGWADYPRSQDRELTTRLLLGGHKGLYVPGMIVHHRIERERLTKAHFRRWHAMEGRMRAGYRFLELFDRDGRIRTPPANGHRVGGVSAFVYRALIKETRQWLGAIARAKPGDAFRHELQMRYLGSYIYRRLTAQDASRRSGAG